MRFGPTSRSCGRFPPFRSVLLAAALLFFASSLSYAKSSVVEAVRVAEKKDFVRIVLDVRGELRYDIERLGQYIQVNLPDTVFSAKSKLPSVRRIAALDRLEKTQLKDGARLYIYLGAPCLSSVFTLRSPTRLVIDLKKDLKEFIRRQVAPGMLFVRIAKVTESGPVTASVLKVDPALFDVRPVLASAPVRKKEDGGILSSVFGFFGRIFWWRAERTPHFFREKTSSMAARAGADAAVNGTYFGRASEPLGILVIDGELVSYPIYDRTALVISDDGRPMIDNVFVDTFVSVEGGVRVDVDGFNQFKGSAADTIVYTRHFGPRTETRGAAEIVVRDGKVSEVFGGNAKIPEDGYVISLGSKLSSSMRDSFRPGSTVGLNIDLMPYSTNHSSNFRHIIGGGPRLLKGGRPYVAKKEEKFKKDIAQGHAARTAVGITGDGKLLFVVVDKTSRIKNLNGIARSEGMTLEELSELLLFFGATEGLNLDGGGSSTLVVGKEVMNVPANGAEIAVSNAIVVRKKD